MLVNTAYFQEEAKRFDRDGAYCLHMPGTYAHREYWEEQHRRCVEGYKVGDLWIPGTFYFYLNFNKILRKDKVTGRKRMMFPLFTDVDLEYFNIIEKARKERKGVAILKARRQGFTYKSALLAVHEYNFYRDSRTVIGAYQSDLSSTAMGYIIDAFNHLDRHTEWKKQRNPDTRDFVKARYMETKNGIAAWRGYMSEIHVLTFKDNPFAAIGKTAGLFIFDEAGKFDGLINSYNISEPCWKDGDDYIGIPILQGTGGDMEGGTQDFYDMFYHPEKYNLLTFDNTWEESRTGGTCGWFVPANRMLFGTLKDHNGKKILDKNGNPIELVDNEGNSNVEAATQSIVNLRKQKAKGHDLRALNDVTTQYPLTPAEAFLRTKSNNFPVAELNSRLAELETKEIYKNAEYVGELLLDQETGSYKWKNNEKLKPLRKFPLRAEDDKTGAIIIYEQPYENADKVTPHGIYLAGIDTFDHKESTTSSLGSIVIYNKLTKRIVAEYTGRPNDDNLFYENCRRLLLYYNARALYENNLKGLFTYFEHKHSAYLLADQPRILKDILMDSRVERHKGMHVTKELRPFGDNLIRQWLIERNGPEDSEVLNLHKLRSIPIIQELVSYNDEGHNAFDRVAALRMLMYLIEETRNVDADKIIQKSVVHPHQQAFFNRVSFKEKNNSYIKPQKVVAE